MSIRRATLRRPGAVLAGAVAAVQPAPGGDEATRFLLIRRDHQVQPVQVAEIGERAVVVGDREQGWTRVDLSQCLALVHTEAVLDAPRSGMLALSDGQRFPGEALSGARPADGVFVWSQNSWLGRMEVPLDRIESVAFLPDATVPEPGDGDVLVLANGDRVEGFVTALGDPISIETAAGGTAGAQVLDFPVDRAVAVRLVPPRREATGRRLWLSDGTVLDVAGILVGDDGVVRLTGMPFVSGPLQRPLSITSLVAVQFDPAGLVPFASLRPEEVYGPPTRFQVGAPEAPDALPPLGLSRILFRGPVTVRYRLPAAEAHLRAEARLPVEARAYGDCDIVVRDGRREVFRARLDARRPEATVAVDLSGPTFEIEITEGGNGPVQDHVVLHRAMLLVE